MKLHGLSYDEKKAAEAAFRGLPVDPSWTAAARQVYEGIVKARSQRLGQGEPGVGSSVEPPGWISEGPTVERAATSDEGDAAGAQAVPITSREEAIAAGFLIDVSEQASAVGLTIPVGITRSLWETGITGSQTIPGGEHPLRVRDVLMALRLHLVHLPGLPIVSQFPALLTFPPEPVPQLCLISALVHPDKTDQAAVTLMLPSELAVTVEPRLN